MSSLWGWRRWVPGAWSLRGQEMWTRDPGSIKRAGFPLLPLTALGFFPRVWGLVAGIVELSPVRKWLQLIGYGNAGAQSPSPCASRTPPAQAASLLLSGFPACSWRGFLTVPTCARLSLCPLSLFEDLPQALVCPESIFGNSVLPGKEQVLRLLLPFPQNLLFQGCTPWNKLFLFLGSHGNALIQTVVKPYLSHQLYHKLFLVPS